MHISQGGKFSLERINREFRLSISAQYEVEQIPGLQRDEIAFFFDPSMIIRVYQSGTVGSKHGGCIPTEQCLDYPARGYWVIRLIQNSAHMNDKEHMLLLHQNPTFEIPPFFVNAVFLLLMHRVGKPVGNTWLRCKEELDPANYNEGAAPHYMVKIMNDGKINADYICRGQRLNDCSLALARHVG